MRQVTDPDILRQLEGDAGPSRVTDPALLEELNRVPTTSHAAGVITGFREAVLDAPAQLLERGVKSVAPGFAQWLEEKTGSPSAQEATETFRSNTARAFGADAPSEGGRLAGNVIGAMAPSALLARGAQAASLLPQALARSPYATAAAGGALSAPLQQTVDDPNAEFWSEKAKQVGAGAVGGAAGRAIGQGVSRALAPAAIRPEAQLLMNEGVTLAPGQQLGGRLAGAEGKLTSIPILGGAVQNRYTTAIEDFNRALYNRVLAPIGEKFSGSVPVGREAVRELRDKLGSAYDDVLERVKFTPDDAFRTGTARLAEEAEAGLTPELARVFEKQVARVGQKLENEGGSLAGDTLKALDEDLNRLVRSYRDGSAAERELARALNDLRSELRSGLARVNPNEAARLSDINSGYALYARIRDAAGRAGALEGVITPTTLGQAVRAGATKTQRAAGGAPLQDIADAAKAVLRNPVPNSGTTDRLLQGAALGGFLVEPLSTTGALAAAGAASLPYRYPAVAAALLNARPSAATRQTIARTVQSAGAPVAGALLRPDEEERLRAALMR
jgi:hypothetical protein